MQQHESVLRELDIRILVVTFEAGGVASAYVGETHIPWPVLVDETRMLYRAYGMLRGRHRDIWGPRSWWAYAKELLRGRLPKSTRADIYQLGGDVLVDPDGIVRFAHVGAGPADRPAVETILQARRESGRP